MTAPAALQHALDPAALRAARLAAGHTLMSAAGAVGRSFSAINRYERGEIKPGPDVLAALAFIYGVHPGDFFRPQT